MTFTVWTNGNNGNPPKFEVEKINPNTYKVLRSEN